jgi:2-dehydro-3-deoxyglucarate aldolase/4-hydroxy-2-oxoheptanedioate aldolase
MKPIDGFRAALAADKALVGCSVGFSDPLVSDALASSMDFLWIDLEHSAMSPEALSGHLLAARAAGIPGIVRVQAAGTGFIKPVLDAGADGIVVPQVRTPAEVRAVVSDCRYPPGGTRGFGPRVPSRYGRLPTAAVVDAANRELFVAVQIETREAYEAVEEIARIPGLDSLVIGPWDLSGAIGTLGEVESPVVLEAIGKIARVARAAGRSVGAGMGALPAYAAKLRKLGVQWLQVGGDSGYLAWAADRIAAETRAALEA